MAKETTSKYATRIVLSALICGAILLAGQPAHAESITLKLNSVTQGTFGCSGTNGCYGNDLTLDVSGAGTNWTVTLQINTTNNTNQGNSIGAVSFILTGFTFSATDINLITAPGGAPDWTEAAGPASASGSGCNSSSTNSVCALDTSLFTVAPSDADAKLSPPGTLTWQWTIQNQAFAGFDSATHIQALFGSLIESGTGCPGGNTPCFKETGLMSTSPVTTPEPATLTMLGIGLVAFGSAVRRRSKRIEVIDSK